VFVDAAGWQELTSGDPQAVRVAARDLQQARRKRAQVRAGRGDVSVILDVVVAVAPDFRSARLALAAVDTSRTVHYAGTVDGLAGLVGDIVSAGVADGVTLIAASPRQDPQTLQTLARDVLDHLAPRGRARAS